MVKSLDPIDKGRFVVHSKRDIRFLKHYYKASAKNKKKGPIQHRIRKYGLVGENKVVFIPVMNGVLEKKLEETIFLF